MAMTLTEAFGGTHITAVGLATGGAVKAIIPPSAVYDAGPMAFAAWVLDGIMAAQAADPGPTTPTVCTRSASIKGANLQRDYRFTINTLYSGVSDTLNASVVDAFN